MPSISDIMSAWKKMYSPRDPWMNPQELKNELTLLPAKKWNKT